MDQNSKVLGHYQDDIDQKSIISYSRLELDAGDLSNFWRRCSITSDFYAKYFSYFFSEKREENSTKMRRGEAEYTISFILNELFENVAKYSSVNEPLVDLEISYLNNNKMIFNIRNFLLRENSEKFKAIAIELLEGNPEELYIRKLEENTESSSSGSGLGYLTLMNDYGAKFGYNFEQSDETLYRVTVQTHLNMVREGE